MAASTSKMNWGSVIVSDTSPLAVPDRLRIDDVSLTYAFMASVFQNDVKYFSEAEIRDTRIYLGSGATSTVYKTSVTPTYGRVRAQTVAIKQKRRRGTWIDEDVSLQSWLRTCCTDLRIMCARGLENARNVVQLLGYCWEYIDLDDNRSLSPCLVMPIAMDNTTSLDTFFETIDPYLASERLKLQLCHDIANGLTELHKCGIVHGDLKLENVLLFGDVLDESTPTIAKISDFSHSIVVDDYSRRGDPAAPRYRGTRPYLIPEVRKEHRSEQSLIDNEIDRNVVLSQYHACDVFSLGILMTEIMHHGQKVSELLVSHAAQNDKPCSRSTTLDENKWIVEDLLETKSQGTDYVLRYCKSSLLDLAITEETRTLVEECLDSSLQDDFSRRGDAEMVSFKLQSQISRSHTNDYKDLKAISRLYGSFTEFTYILAKFGAGSPIKDFIMAQILDEFHVSSTFRSAIAHFLLASCYALGFGTPHDPALLVSHLRTASSLGHFTSTLILDRVAQCALENEQSNNVHFIAPKEVLAALRSQFSDQTTPEYTQRVRQLKVLAGPRGGLRLIRASSANETIDVAPDEILYKTLTVEAPLPSRRFSFVEAQQSAEVDEHSAMDRMAAELYEIDLSLEDAIETLEKTRIGMVKASSKELLHLAATFFASNNSTAAQFRVLHFVRAILHREGTGKINALNELGETPLHVLCRNGHFLAARHLLRNGADASMSDEAGLTPLHWLSMFEDDHMLEIAELLVAASGDLDATTTSILHVPEHCLGFQPDYTPLHYAVSFRSLTAVKVLLTLGADVNKGVEVAVALHYYILSPMHFAVCLHFHEIVSYLLEQPGVKSMLRYRKQGTSEAHEIHAVHLIGVPIMIFSDTAPFVQFMMQGRKYRENLEKTLLALEADDPRKDVLLLCSHNITITAIPPEVPWKLQLLLEHGYGPRRLAQTEMHIEPQQEEYQALDWNHVLWIRAAVDASMKKGSAEVLRLVLDHFPEGYMPPESILHAVYSHCARDDMETILKEMLSRYRSITGSGMSVLHHFFKAAKNDAIDVIKVLYEDWACNEAEDTARSVWCGHQFQNHKLIRLMQLINLAIIGHSALHDAASGNAARVIDFLMSQGAHVDLDMDILGTPLNVAAGSLRTRDAAMRLLKSGASIRCCKADGENYTVLHRAVSDPDLELRGDQQFSLVSTLLEAFPEQFLEDEGLTLNLVDRYGQSVLHRAVMMADVSSVQALLELPGIDLSMRDLLGETALTLALRQAHYAHPWTEASFKEFLVEKMGYSEDSVYSRDLSHIRQWYKSVGKRIAKMLIDKGSPIPSRNSSTGDYDFLLEHAAKQVIMHIIDGSDDDIKKVTYEAFRDFEFFQQPTHELGQPAMIMYAAERRELLVYPEGHYRGAPILIYRHSVSVPE